MRRRHRHSKDKGMRRIEDRYRKELDYIDRTYIHPGKGLPEYLDNSRSDVPDCPPGLGRLVEKRDG